MFGRPRRGHGLKARHRPGRRAVGLTVLAAVATIVIAEVASDVVNSSGSASLMEARTYAAALVPIVDESTALSSWVTDVRHHPVELGRDGIAVALVRLVSGCDHLTRELGSLGVSAPNRRSATLVGRVLSSRATGARAFAAGVYRAIGPARSQTGAAASFSRAASYFAASDRSYLAFVRSLPRKVRSGHTLPPSRWLESANWSKDAVESYAMRLADARELRLEHALSIVALTLEPQALRITGLPTTTSTTTTTTTTTSSTTTTTSAVATTAPASSTTTTSTMPATTTSTTTTTTLQVPPAGSTSWLPATTRATVIVVVANAGDESLEDVSITATATPVAGARTAAGRTRSKRGGKGPRGGPPPTSRARQVLRHLGAASSAVVALGALSLRPGAAYELTVRLGRQAERIRLQVAAG